MLNAVMEVIKKNMLSIICAVIAMLACVAVWFWPLPGKFDALRTTLKARQAEYNSLAALAAKQRHYPRIDPSQGEAKPLERFPTPEVIKAEDAVTQQITSESKALQDLAERLNRHTLLVPLSLPAPVDTVGYDYVTAYQKQMDFQNPDFRNDSLPVRVLHAGIPPTPAEVEAEKAKRRQAIIDRDLIPGQNDAEVAKRIAEMELTVAEDMKRDIAEKSQMYMNADALDVYPGVIGATKPPMPTGWAPLIWYSQVGLWVQQDVFEALAAANKGSDGVVDSAVKHLIKIDVNESASLATAAAPSPGQTSSAGGNPTQRSSNAVYDVIPFKLTIFVDAAKIPHVLSELAKNKFITVTKCDLTGIDAGVQALAGYYYGNSPVVALNLDCEELFLKSWTTPLIPANATAPTATPGQ